MRRLTVLFAIAIAIMLAACGDDSAAPVADAGVDVTSPPEAGPLPRPDGGSGLYTLCSID